MFSLDKDATLTVTARDKQSGKVEVKKKVFFYNLINHFLHFGIICKRSDVNQLCIGDWPPFVDLCGNLVHAGPG